MINFVSDSSRRISNVILRTLYVVAKLCVVAVTAGSRRATCPVHNKSCEQYER